MTYSSMRTTKDFDSFLKSLYAPRRNKIETLDVPRMRYLRYDGQGAPRAPSFTAAIQCLYSMAYALKMGMKHGKLPQPKGYYDYKIPPLEGLWWLSGEFAAGDLEKAKWRLLIMQPSFIDESLYKAALAQASAKNPDFPWKGLRHEWFDEGQSVQTMHIGPYVTEPATVALIQAHMKQNNLSENGPHHEIYLSDPRRTAPDKLKTIIRYPVKRAKK
jgi:hypothetical protein